MSSPEKSKRVLVVEDEWLIALDIAMLVEENGHAVVGPVRTVAEALALIEVGGIDAAILDISLGLDKSYPIAHALEKIGVPLVFLSAYNRNDIPEEYGRFALLAKPLVPLALENQLHRMLGRP